MHVITDINDYVNQKSDIVNKHVNRVRSQQDSPEDIGWLDVIVDKCRNIRILKAGNCPVNREGLKKLSESCVRLRELVITPEEGDFLSSFSINDNFIDVIKNLENLESLEIIKNDIISSLRLSDKFMLCLLSSRIKRFKCPNAEFSSRSTFMMTSYCQPTKLEELDLSCTYELTDEMITFIAAKSPNLKTLNIKDCVKITEQGIVSIVEFCPLLESLSSSVTLTLHSMKCLAANCTNLHILKLVSVYYPTKYLP